MGFIEGLAAKNETDKKSGGDFKERVKAKYVGLKDGEEEKLVFLQEIDKGSPNYSEKNGLAKLFLEHSNPDDWKKNAECTADEGACFGCENGWKQKRVFYINALVVPTKGDPYVAVFSRGLGKGSVAQTLYSHAADEDYNLSITDKIYKFSRTGSTKDDTTYTLSPLPKASTYDTEDYTDELFDLTGVPFHVDYSRQEKYYTGVEGGSKATAVSSAPAQAPSASSIDNDW